MGAYELVDELGAGGMGVVWRAHDRRLGRDVALKILPPHLAIHPDSLARFEREAKGLAALSHPNIVSIFDLGEEQGVRYLVTELLAGETLRQRLRRGRLPWPKALEIAATVADGLAAAHSKGIVHRDLKPENIFITSDDRVKILDFGLAKEIAPVPADATTQAHHTEPGTVVGTLGYMSPEQLRGEETDYASDIFSLGCLLYEMLSGVPAFLRGSGAETIAAILTAEPRPISQVSDLSADVQRILQRCMEKQPRARYQSARDLAFALRSAASAASAAPAGEPRRTPRLLSWAAPALAALVTVATLIFLSTRVKEPVTPRSAISPSLSLAVAPFSSDAEIAYAGQGLAESLFRRLVNFPSLRVVSLRSAPVDISPAAAGAEHLLRGRVAGDARSLTVIAEVVDLRSSAKVWENSYRGGVGDLLGVENRIAADLERFFAGRVGSTSAAPPPRGATTDPAAYREYLKGRHHWNRFTIAGFNQAREHFTRSIDIDPTYALAYSGLADTYTMLAFYGESLEDRPKAREASRRAIELDPLLGEGYTSLGSVLYLYDWKFSEAGELLRRGVELNPRHPTAHHSYAVWLGIVGRTDEALRHIRIASELDPLSLVIYVDTAWIHYQRNDRDEAVRSIKRAVRHDPRSASARDHESWYLEQVGDYAAAIEAYEASLKLDGADVAPARERREAFRARGRDGYLDVRLKQARSAGESHCNIADILIQRGEHEKALAELEAAVAKRERNVIYLKTAATYQSIRAHPRFRVLLRKVGLEDVAA